MGTVPWAAPRPVADADGSRPEHAVVEVAQFALRPGHRSARRSPAAAVNTEMLSVEDLAGQRTADRLGGVFVGDLHADPARFGQDVGGQRMKAPVVVEDAVDAELSELAVLDPADLHAEQAAGRAHQTHPPGQTAFGVGGAQAEQHRGSGPGDPLADVRVQLAFGTNGSPGEDRSSRGQRDRGRRQHPQEREQGQPQPPWAATALKARDGRGLGLPGAGRAAVRSVDQVLLQLGKDAHLSPTNLARRVRRPRLTRWRTTASEQSSSAAISA